MKVNQVLVVYKQVTDNSEHLAALSAVYDSLKAAGISFEAISTKQLNSCGEEDLIVTVGGDGTVLYTSHFVEDRPILGVKSFGKKSVGFFCAATKETFGKILKEILEGKREPIRFHRLKLKIDGQNVEELALNDVLFANFNAAGTSKYKISIGGRSEEQKSSGIWISTAAGSTAAIKAAGGSVMPLESGKLQYLVREPYLPNGSYKLKKGILSEGAVIKIKSQIAEGTAFIDGGATRYPMPVGSVMEVSNAKKLLNIFWR